jgi:hypothetical protein
VVIRVDNLVCLPGFLVWHLQTGEIINYSVGRTRSYSIFVTAKTFWE